MVLFLAALLFGRPAQADDRPSPEARMEVQQDRDGAPGVADVLAMAEDMRKTGAPSNCRQILSSIDGMVGDAQLSDYLYLRGFCAELAWEAAAARDDYLRVIDRGAAHVTEARFRLALVLEDLGDGHGALQQMVILHKNDGWNLDDQIAVNLERALAQVAAGKRRVGLKNLDTALIIAQSWDKHTWLRAKARYVQIDGVIAAAERARIAGGEQHQTDALKERARALAEAQQAMLPLIADNEPEWIVRALYRLGTAYLTLGDELIAARPPVRLTPDQEVVYRQQLAAERDRVRDTASHLYDQGVQLSLRVRFESPWVARMVLERDRLGLARRAFPGYTRARETY